jgi:hypothetical protein
MDHDLPYHAAIKKPLKTSFSRPVSVTSLQLLLLAIFGQTEILALFDQLPFGTTRGILPR